MKYETSDCVILRRYDAGTTVYIISKTAKLPDWTSPGT
jgi:hypothetical protein